MALNFSSLEIGVRLAFEKGHLRETFSDREKKLIYTSLIIDER